MHYRPLDIRSYETRFVSIEPGTAGPVRCRLHYYSLLDPPPYTALSYCWGDRLAVEAVFVDGEEIAVLCGLEPALQQMRSDGIGLLWVDAISINQNDAQEKSHQVNWMDRIFSQATTVISWLGTATPGSKLAFGWLADRKGTSPTFGWRDALQDFTSRSYWERQWVIQEIAKGSNVYVQCGHQRQLWEDIMPTLAFVEELLSERNRELHKALRLFRRVERSERTIVGRMNLRDALMQSRNSVATDARDKIYALLSLTSDGHDAIPFPNYKDSVCQVFTRVSSYIIKSQRRTAFMPLARRFHPHGLPSWVPDWSDLGGQLPPWIVECAQTETELSPMPPSSSMWQLKVRGLRLETITFAFRTADEPKNDRPSHIISDADGQSTEPEFFRLILGLWSILTMSQAHRRFTPSGRILDRQVVEPEFYAMAVLCLDPELGTRVHTWMDNNGVIKLRGGTILELLDEYRNWYQSARHPPARLGLVEDTKVLLEEGLKTLEKYQMRVIVNANDVLRVAYRGARAGDQIYRVQNCPLPLVLRPCKGGHQFVGDVFLLSSGNGLDDSAWAEAGVVSMHADVQMQEIITIS